MFKRDEAINVEAVSPSQDSGIVVEDVGTFDLDEALLVQSKDEIADKQDIKPFDLEKALAVKNEAPPAEENDREPLELRTGPVGDSDVIFSEGADPTQELSDNYLSDIEDLIDTSSVDYVEIASSDSDDEPQFLKPVPATFPSQFSPLFNVAKTEDTSGAEVSLSNPTAVSGELDSRHGSRQNVLEDVDIDADAIMRPTSSPAPSTYSSSIGKCRAVNTGVGLHIGDQPFKSSPSTNGSDASELSKQNECKVAKSSVADILQASEVSFTYSQPDGSKTFLPVSPTLSEVLTPAQVVTDNAGCSSNTILAVKDISVSQLHDVISSFNSSDAEKISDQLDRNSLVEWNPNSIIDGLGKDVNGNHTSLSLVQLSNSLSNFNEHLLIMQKELLKYETAIKQSRIEGQLEYLGFNDPTNITHLSTVLNSLNMANRNMDQGVTNIMQEIKGQSARQLGKGFSMKALVVIGVGTAMGSLLMFRNKL